MNIIYLHTHDTGKVISSYGYNVHTPNYQTLCEDSLLFQHAFSVAPTCSPSRAGLLTGVYPHQNGMLGLAQRGFELKKELHLAKILKDNGYRTALCGVQHEIGYYTDHQMAVNKLGYQVDLTADNSLYKEEDLVFWDQKNRENLLQWLDNYDENQPFFVSYGMHATHRKFPTKLHQDENPNYSQPILNLPNNEITRKDFAQFKTSLRMADDNIGAIIQKLKEKKLYEKTIIILTTDHGLAYPFEKCTLNDSGTGVLLAMHVPNMKREEKSYDGLISQIDIMPTLFDLIGIEKPNYLEGKSFANLFFDKEYEENEYVFSEINFHTSYEPVRSVRTKRYKYIRYFDTTYLKINQSNIDNSAVKEFYNNHELAKIEKPEEGLYDLYYDQYEKNNLIKDKHYEEVLYLMRSKLQEFMQDTKDPLLQGPIKIQEHWKVNKKDTYSASSKNLADYESLGKK